MNRPSVALKKSLIFVHRWLGVALCLLFTLWFVSGIVMMYWDFPSVTAVDRLERSVVLDPVKVRLSPAQAFERRESKQSPDAVRLASFDGRPVYRFRFGRDESLIYADNGEEQIDVSSEMVARIASSWTRHPAGLARLEALKDVDQWTVQGGFRDLQPIWKYSWPNGEQVYVSGASGEVVQYTTSASRFWAYLGAIPHWLYFTPLRKHQGQWSRFVIWTSGIGTIASILGITIGVWMYSPRKRYRNAGVATTIPYRGQKRLHTIFGLIFGLTAVSWAFSGMLSMDPFPLRAGRTAGGFAGAFHESLDLRAFDAKHPREALNTPVKQLELSTFGREAFYLATLASGATSVIPMRGDSQPEFDRAKIIEVVRNTAGVNLASIGVMPEYDAYYIDRHHQRPLPVIVVKLNDADHTRYYIDPKTARIVGSYSTRAWVTRWLYHGLHSLDFPWLYKYRPLWDVVVISLMAGGTTLCVTSLILAWRVMKRKLSALAATASEDLPVSAN